MTSAGQPLPDPGPAREVSVAVCGLGAWGRNVARTFGTLSGAELEFVCDADDGRLAQEGTKYPEAEATTQFDRVIGSDVKAVVLTTPAPLHFPMAREALEAGKHVFVEKPMTMSSAQAEELVDLAEKTDRVLMVGHLLVYHPAVELMREMIDSGEIGEVHYMQTQRVNLGVVRQDENALWSLAPHDFSVIHHLFGKMPSTVSARGTSFLQPGIEDVVFVNLEFADGRMAQVHVSWLDPRKERRMVLVGSRRMIEFDDMQASEKIRIYDKGAEVTQDTSTDMIGAIRVRHGDLRIPQLDGREPLQAEAAHFLDCIREGREPRTGPKDGLRVVRLLEAASESLRLQGAPVRVTESE